MNFGFLCHWQRNFLSILDVETSKNVEKQKKKEYNFFQKRIEPFV